MIQETQLRAMSIDELKTAIDTRETKLDRLSIDLEAMPFDMANATPGQKQAIDEMTGTLADGQAELKMLRDRLAKIEPREPQYKVF